jgi:L-2-hydroxycarboxylate dehydrogenase (NAD+)
MMKVGDVRFAVERLEVFVASVFEAVGVSVEHGRLTARRLVEADVRGRTGHGVIRVAPYVERIEAGGVNLAPNIRVTHETPTSALIDGDNGLGQVVMTQAAELAIAKATTSGMAWVGTVSSNHAGAAGLYPLMAARAGLISMYFAVANANGMPAWGGTEHLLGTNPIAIAVPDADGSAFVLDIATTVASHGSIKVVAQAGEQMPVGWVVGPDGEPITDPDRVHEGSLMPIGGYKGSGLNIAIGLLAGVLNGAAFGSSVIDHRADLSVPTNTGQAMMVLRPDLFMPADAALASISEHLAELRSSRADGTPVRLPGDRAEEVARDNTEFGVPVPSSLLSILNTLAVRLGLEPLCH